MISYVVSEQGLGSPGKPFRVGVPGHRFAAKWSDDGVDLLLKDEDGNHLVAGASWLTFDLHSGGLMSRVQWAGMPRGSMPTRTDRVPRWMFAWNANKSRIYGSIEALLFPEEIDRMMAQIAEIERFLGDNPACRRTAAAVVGGRTHGRVWLDNAEYAERHLEDLREGLMRSE